MMGGLERKQALRSGELAKLTGVSTDTLRHYERLGLLARPGRTRAGYRLYAPEAVERVHLVRRAVAVGFSLQELVRILRVRDSGGAPCKQVRDLAVSKLEQLEERLKELRLMHQHLKQLIAAWNTRLDRTPEGQPARLLEMLSGSLPSPSQKRTKP